MKKTTSKRKVTGQTQDVGFQIGVRRTFAVSPQQAWDLLTSGHGLRLWLGDVVGFRLAKGETYRTKDDAEGEVRVVNPGGHFRLTWRPKGWQKASTIQVRVIPSGEKTVISFHQEHLLGSQEREQMHQRWERALDDLQAFLE